MAEAIGITASVIAIVTLGFQVAKGLYNVADQIGAAGAEVRMYAGEISDFAKLLNHIRTDILTLSNVPFNARTLIEDVTSVCDKVLQPFKRLQSTLDAFATRFKHAPGKLRNLGVRVKWAFSRKKELLFYLGALRSQHRVLDTALAIAKLQMGKDQPPDSVNILQVCLENSMAAINLSRDDGTSGMILSITHATEQSAGLILPSTSHPTVTSAKDPGSPAGSDTTNELPPQSSPSAESWSNRVLTRIDTDDDADDLSGEDVRLLEQQINHDVDPDGGTTAHEVWAETHVISQKAKRLARETLVVETLTSQKTQVIGLPKTTFTFNHRDYTVAWICTRPLEYAVAEGMLDEQHPDLPQVENDSNTYSVGKIARHNVVLVCIPAKAMDTGVASTAVSSMLRSFPNVKIRLLVGIADGVSNENSDIRLGDVVVGSSGTSRGGLILFTGSGDSITETGTLETPPRELGNALSTIRARHIRRDTRIPHYIEQMLEANPAMRPRCSAPEAENDLLFTSEYEHNTKGHVGCFECYPDRLVHRAGYKDTPSVHYGPIGWTSMAIKSGLDRDRIARLNPVCSIEQETMGLINFFPCVMIRGIWNYADSHWNNTFQGYAAATAAAYAKELLEIVQVS
ncbi:nucleoside phosphorylase domain-containing protein [Aspergillus karnatakaensis]|uniref:nucleoside phosphorylase domain-containing protein n=1 Tax=Aspergillus karnatakaensis TaxID=1810916 RepID=UPI003CCDFD09